MSEERKDSLCLDAAALNSLDSGWDYSIELECLQGPEDLQLAAELGKTLLERNKELENSLKQHQNVIEDQTQEIEYLTKQTAALREVNDSRLRIYEQLEVSIQDLERANQRLTLENSADKKHIKSLCVSIDSLEARCEELQRNLDEMTLQQDSYRLRQQRNHSICSSPGAPPPSLLNNGSLQNAFNDIDMKEMAADEEEIIQMLTQMQELRSQRMKEQRKVADLEEQLATVLKDNLCLEEQLAILQQKEADMKSMQEEISTLEEVRQGHLCGRCLRNVDSRGQDELSLLMDHEEEEDASVVNSLASDTHRSSVILQIGGSPGHHPHYDNPYRVLVEKYEALVQMQRPIDNKRHSMAANSLSLQEELQMSGDFNSFNAKDNDAEENDAVVPNKDTQVSKVVLRKRTPAAKTISTTPTDFSEAETSSSGFSDETSNKMTQTEIDIPPGSFLCTIADGSDCRFSIYDDANPIESRFRKKPQYRQLFREIFDVLKRAAENKDEGEQLPLLDDITPIIEAPKVPPVTPAREDPPSSFPSKQPAESFISEEDTRSIADELAALTNELLDSKIQEIKFESASQGKVEEKPSAEVVKKSPPKQDILEYLSIGVGIKKKSNGKKNSPSKSHRTTSVAERVERIESPLVGACGVSHSGRSSNPRKRRESRLSERLADSSPSSRPESPRTPAWYNREAGAAASQPQSAWDFKPYVSSASQEVAKLKRLEKSYAEVLRLQPQPSHRPVSFNGYRRH